MTFKSRMLLSAPRLTLTAAAVALSLLATGCATSSAEKSAAVAVQQKEPVLRQDVTSRLYELDFGTDGRLYVTSASGQQDAKTGRVLALDPDTLAVQRTIDTPYRAFALASNRKTGTLYVGNTMDHALTAIDVASGQVKGTLQFDLKNERDALIQTRQVVVDEESNTVFIGGVDNNGVIWVVDGDTLALRTTLRLPASTGMVFDAAARKLYTSSTGVWNVIDTSTLQVIAEHSVSDKRRRFLINLSLDAARQRLFATDFKYGDLLVFDAGSGALVKQIATGAGALAVRYNPVRDEIYVSHRDAGTVTVLDGENYGIKKTYDLPIHPNSLAVDASGQVLYVSVKQTFDKKLPGYRADRMESIVRIALD